MSAVPPPIGRRASLFPLFLVSLFSVSFETFLTRYFAVAVLSSYSYWIISIALFGYSVAGVILAILRDPFLRRKEEWLFAIPPALLVAGVLAFVALRANPFNPLQLQNEVLWKTQLPNIFLYYAVLFPVFFLAGLFVGLTFMARAAEISKVYTFDLLGAAGGSAFILGAMFLVHPYHLPALALPALFLAIVILSVERFGGFRSLRAAGYILACLGALCLAAGYILSINQFSFPNFKGLFAILNIGSSKVVRSEVSPSGTYVVMDDYTEFDDVRMTNNYDSMKITSPPRSYGLYRDGQRITSLLKEIPSDLSYVKGSMPDFPYELRGRPSVLLIGTNGGYRLFETPGSRSLSALEQQATSYRLISDALGLTGGSKEASAAARALTNGSVFAFLRGAARYDVIDVSVDLLKQDDNNRYAFTVDAMELYLRSLSPGGILSIPADISEFTVYALKLVNTAVEALRRTGVKDPARNLIVYRSAWEARILVSTAPFSAADIARLIAWCRERSFDTSYYPGIDPSTIEVWNDLPPISFGEQAPPESARAEDSLMLDIAGLFGKGTGLITSDYFDLTPSTFDRPSLYSISRISRIRDLLSQISLLPEQEIGYLINLAVLAQALILALLIVFLPLGSLRGRSGLRVSSGVFSRMALYFTALGLGYLFMELAFIEKFSFLLGSDSASFGIVLAVMLVFSGLGSWRSSRFSSDPYPAILRALPVVCAVLLFVIFGLDRVMTLAVSLPVIAKVSLIVVVVAPVSFGMGRFFPLGNASLGESAQSLIPWAWAINGAFSVIATPLANIISARVGWRLVAAAALLLYLSTLASFPMKSLLSRGSRLRG